MMADAGNASEGDKALTSPPPASADDGEEPVLIGGPRFSPKHKVDVYEAVDYIGTRFRVGDCVCMNTLKGQEWVCVIEAFFKNERGIAMFKGRWFWSVDDVEEQRDSFKEVMRPSKCASHELIASDSWDTNIVELITRRCHILSYENFQLVKDIVTRADCSLEKVYFCHRQFYHLAFRFSELDNTLFPGDSIPLPLRKAAGLPINTVNSNDYHYSSSSSSSPTLATNSDSMISW